jgi:hypothetical protein
MGIGIGIGISSHILGLVGQRVNVITLDEQAQQINIISARDRPKKVIDPVTGIKGTVNRYVCRQVRDVPFLGNACVLEIDLAQMFVSKNVRRMEACEFFDKGNRFTLRFCRLFTCSIRIFIRKIYD